MPEIDATVVIGFRDWGADRVRRSATSILNSFGKARGEVVISDYGSMDPEPAKKVATDLGVKYVFTPREENWSRSRALNAGFAIGEGRLLISTDADMLFSPTAMERIIETATEAEHGALFLQCRDLPQHMGDEYFANTTEINWRELEKHGRLRPRWGMGGMMAIPVEGYEQIRGFDERLHTYGGEDLDFAQRARRAGYRTIWVDDPQVRMYHMWHPPTARVVEQTEAGREAVKFNRNVVYNDKTFTRNTTGWKFASPSAAPLVSVVFSTRDRPDLLREALKSTLIQTVQDFEVIVVDDGSENTDTRDVVESFNDRRLRYFWQQPSGISAARNLALRESRGIYTAVMDDDDLMPPQRLEWQLDAVTQGYVGSVGSFVNFDDATGETELIVSKKPTLAQAAEAGGAPGHGTWLIRTDVMRAIGYHESIPSGVDNNFFLRLLRSGYKVAHSGNPVLLRRRHNLQVTAVDSGNQGDAARQALEFFQYGITAWHMKKLAEEAASDAYPSIGDRGLFAQRVQAYLPDHLVHRDAEVTLTHVPDVMPEFEGDAKLNVLSRNGVSISAKLAVSEATYSDMVTLARIGHGLEAKVRSAASSGTVEDNSWQLAALEDFQKSVPVNAPIAIYRIDSSGATPADGTLYTFGTSSDSESIAIAHFSDCPAGPPSPWIVVGPRAEEYWA